jgi:hypothetical protein
LNQIKHHPSLRPKDVIHMTALLILAAIAIVAIVATIVTVARDGYSRTSFHAADSRDAWPSSAQPVPTRLA